MAEHRWLRRVAIGGAVVLVAGGIGFFALAPSIVEASMNQIEAVELTAVTEDAQALHDTLFIADLHSDTLMWKRDPLQPPNSDFDGATTVAWDTSQLAVITQELMNRGFSDEEIAAIMRGNTLRVLLEVLPD